MRYYIAAYTAITETTLQGFNLIVASHVLAYGVEKASSHGFGAHLSNVYILICRYLRLHRRDYYIRQNKQ